MSIILDALKHKITWGQAASQIVAWGEKLISSDPAAVQAIGTVIAVAKQAASNALADGETALSPHIIPAIEVMEAALDKALAGASGGLSLILTPITDAAITKIAESVKAGADAWALEQKAKAAAAAPAPQVKPPVLAPGS
jgi:hypothetical protein